MRDSYERFFSQGYISKDQFFEFGLSETIYAPLDKAEAAWEKLKHKVHSNQQVFIRGFGRNSNGTHLFQAFYAKLNKYWPAEARFADVSHFKLPDNFQEKIVPKINMTHNWSFSEFIGYMNTWSALKEYRLAHGIDSLNEEIYELKKHWGPTNLRKTVTWPINLRLAIKLV